MSEEQGKYIVLKRDTESHNGGYEMYKRCPNLIAAMHWRDKAISMMYGTFDDTSVFIVKEVDWHIEEVNE